MRLSWATTGDSELAAICSLWIVTQVNRPGRSVRRELGLGLALSLPHRGFHLWWDRDKNSV